MNYFDNLSFLGVGWLTNFLKIYKYLKGIFCKYMIDLMNY